MKLVDMVPLPRVLLPGVGFEILGGVEIVPPAAVVGDGNARPIAQDERG